MANAALQLTRVSKVYGSFRAVKDLSLEVREGEIFGLLGPNGAGKSTSINMISGLTRITDGVIRVFGHDAKHDFTVTRKLVGVMHQEVIIDNFFTVNQALKMHSGYFGKPDDPAWRNTLIDRLALRPFADRKPLQLSGGTKRRLMLAKALIHKPRLLILDEPTAGVDVELRHTVWEFVREMNHAGTTIVLTTHYLEEAQKMCARIAIMKSGELVALDETASLLDRVGEKKILVKLQAAIADLPAALRELGGTLSPERDQISFPARDIESLDRILRALPALKVGVRDIESQRADLEDVFLKLTGGLIRA